MDIAMANKNKNTKQKQQNNEIASLLANFYSATAFARNEHRDCHRYCNVSSNAAYNAVFSSIQNTLSKTLTKYSIILCLFPTVVYAEQSNVIGSKVMQGSGRAAINQSAGHNNIQTNSHAIGRSAPVSSQQSNQLSNQAGLYPEATGDDEMHLSSIESMAFENFQGLLSVNQIAGQNNMQSNLGGIALDSITGLGLSDDALTQVSTQSVPSFKASQYQTDIAIDSFQKASGVMQVNQISGNNNVSVNQFSLQLPSGK